MAVLLFADGQNIKRLFSYFLAKGEFLSPLERSQIVHVQWNAQPEIATSKFFDNFFVRNNEIQLLLSSVK